MSRARAASDTAGWVLAGVLAFGAGVWCRGLWRLLWPPFGRSTRNG